MRLAQCMFEDGQRLFVMLLGLVESAERAIMCCQIANAAGNIRMVFRKNLAAEFECLFIMPASLRKLADVVILIGQICQSDGIFGLLDS